MFHYQLYYKIHNNINTIELERKKSLYSIIHYLSWVQQKYYI